MSRYTMAQIVTLTGVKAHTLRKWETRYNFLDPERTDTNIRYYSDLQLKKLLNISVLTRKGYRISKIDKMSDDEIYKIISDSLEEGDYEDEISALVISMLDMDEVRFNELLRTHIVKNGLLATITELVYPFLNKVGVLWGMNKVMPAQEHFISNLIKKKMFASIDLLPYPHKDSPSILMFLVEGEHHEIGLLLAYYIAREMGWKVYYLGQNVPIDNIKQVVEEIKPEYLLTMFVTPAEDTINTTIATILNQAEDVPLLFSGNPIGLEKVEGDSRIFHLSHPKDLISCLKK
ncbi:MerR family transcriptional regulator [Lacinutrix sp. C3R15]|uniref:MerR family transcriptional regulator n=1 Tax=Flavobacteriaceae TaxID=49546 RepID=UPI001C0931DE|nr:MULTISPECIES: MerR family transcriptional regulator [Flavobacteriaceae]MBU2940021.1 MerR family transcriptional regulator [Lacinutrix sp. C3R15]MDO6623338.1 MerR family transcriptional regulator [Oceanihabitans sp. 1_MG-2023]